MLGTWQGIYFIEFDGPRTRTYFVKVAAQGEAEGEDGGGAGSG